MAPPRRATGAERLLEETSRKVQATSTRHLRGVPVNRITGAFDRDKMRFPFPIFGCLCVQDSPQNPCPCTNTVLWLTERPIAATKTGTKNADGQDVIDFTLPRDVSVAIDVQVPIKLGDLERVARRVRRQRQGVVVTHGRNGVAPPGRREPGVQYAPVPDFGWVGLAAAAGWAVGTVLDDLAGSNEGGNDNFSDDISDWAAENFPAPDWLEDIF